MRCPRWLILIPCLLVGCSFSGDELLEAQLRLRDDRIRILESQLADSRQSASAIQEETRILRARLDNPSAVPSNEQFAAGFAVKQLEFQSLLTGVIEDGRIHAVIRPTDRDGDIVKLPGELEVRLVNLSSAEGEKVVGSWTWTKSESRELWSSAAIGAGYVVDLPATGLTEGTELVLHARFKPGDGRQFDASHAVSIPEREGPGVLQVGFDDK